MSHRTWIYHPSEEPRVIDQADYDQYYAQGWRDSPASFANVAAFGINPDDPVAVQQVGDAVQGVADALNGALNLNEMEKDEILLYAETHFNRDLSPQKLGLNALRAKVQAMVDGHGDG
jgi:hypothetical protein